MNQAAEARHAAAAERELRVILRAADKKISARKPAIHAMMTAPEVCRLFNCGRETVRRWVASGKLPPPIGKALSAPADPIQRAKWQRDRRRWDRRLMEALAMGILPAETKTFTHPEHWRQWFMDHHEGAEYAA